MRILILLLLFTFNLNAQNDLSQTMVVYCDGTKDELFTKAKNVIIEAYNDPQHVMQHIDKRGESITVKAAFPYHQSRHIFGGSDLTKGEIEYILTIQFKDGRYRYEVKNFYHKADRSFGYITSGQAPNVRGTHKKWRANVWEDLQKQTKLNTTALTTLIQLGMKKTVKTDW